MKGSAVLWWVSISVRLSVFLVVCPLAHLMNHTADITKFLCMCPVAIFCWHIQCFEWENVCCWRACFVCADICTSFVWLRSVDRRLDTVPRSRLGVLNGRHSAHSGEGRSSLVAGAALDHRQSVTYTAACRPCSFSRTAGVEDQLLHHRESQTKTHSKDWKYVVQGCASNWAIGLWESKLHYLILFLLVFKSSLTALCPGLPWWASTNKVKPTCIYWSRRLWVAVTARVLASQAEAIVDR